MQPQAPHDQRSDLALALYEGRRSATVWPSGPLRVNNCDAAMLALIAGVGVSILPKFFLSNALACNQLERLLPDWSIPLGALPGDIVRGAAAAAR